VRACVCGCVSVCYCVWRGGGVPGAPSIMQSSPFRGATTRRCVNFVFHSVYLFIYIRSILVTYTVPYMCCIYHTDSSYIHKCFLNNKYIPQVSGDEVLWQIRFPFCMAVHEYMIDSSLTITIPLEGCTVFDIVFGCERRLSNAHEQFYRIQDEIATTKLFWGIHL